MLATRFKGDFLGTELSNSIRDDVMKESKVIPVSKLEKAESTKHSMSVMDLGKMLLQFCKEGDTVKVHELMCRGAPFSTDWLGTSPIHLAAMHNHLETCEVLLRAGISKDAKTKVDRTPLHFAVYEGHEAIVQLLLSHKCEVDTRDMLKMTPLHWAVQKRHKNIVEALLQNNATPNIVSKFGKTPAIIAAETGQHDVVKMLEDAINYRVENPQQTQEATDHLVFEMQQSATPTDEQDRIPSLTPIEMDTDYQMFTDTDNSNNNMDSIEEDDNIIEDSDDGTSLSEAIIQLQNVEEPQRPMDTTTLQMLKEHGISMIQPDDGDSSLITNAIQSGRKFVLSEAGKIVLNDPKFRKLFTDSPPHPSSMGGSHNNQEDNNMAIVQSSPTPVKIIQKKMPMVVPNKNFPLKTNKVIKILSAEQFKQICGGELSHAIKKFANDSNSNAELKINTTGKVGSGGSGPTIVQINNSKLKKNVITKAKFNVTQPGLHSLKNIAFKSPMTAANVIGLDGLITRDVSRVTSQPSPSLSITREFVPSSPSSPISNLSSPPTMHEHTFNGSSIAFTPAAPQPQHTSTMTQADIEKQMLELKRVTEDLRKQMELLQQENAEFRIRIAHLESERIGMDQHHHNIADESNQNEVDDDVILSFITS